MDWNTLYSKKNLLQWSKSQNTLTILYGQKWLMLDVRDREIMDDVFRLINLRKRIPS